MNKKPRKRGGQPGNTNAKKHGGYTTVRLEVLDDEERDMISDIDTDEEYQLEEQLRLFCVRERRILKAIKCLNERGTKTGDVEISSLIGFQFENKDSVTIKANGDCSSSSSSKANPKWCNKNYEKAELAVLRFEKELTCIQRSKTRVINALAELRRHKDNSSDDWLEAFFSAVSETDDL